MSNSQMILSICTRCRDGREQDYQEVRGGERMAKAILARQFAWKDFSFGFRGMACTSNCKRPCVAAICGHGRFLSLFGDPDPEMPSTVDALLEFPSIYLTAPEGFVERRNRPIPLQKDILARLPPAGSTSKNVFSYSS